MEPWQIVVAYLIFGPPLGALIGTFGAGMFHPSSGAELPGVFGFFLLFSYPYGGLAALVSGIAHALLYAKVSRVALIALVSVAGACGHGVVIAIIAGIVHESNLS